MALWCQGGGLFLISEVPLWQATPGRLWTPCGAGDVTKFRPDKALDLILRR